MIDVLAETSVALSRGAVALVDLEACALSHDSWPIEIGAGWIAGDDVAVVSSLIRPHPSWPRSAWSSVSAAVHGIAEAELEMAPSAAEVAARFAGMLAGSVVLSDAPTWDGRWLQRLMATLDPAPRIAVTDFDAAVRARFGARAFDAVYERLARLRAPHRAGPDARRLALAWRAGLRAEVADTGRA
jgi:hypothetical protein